MNLTIEEKLTLSQTPVQIFKEGIFLKVYNESLYIVHQHFKFYLKPQIKVEKQSNQTILIGGFPVKSLAAKFPHAEPTPYGYQLLGEYDLSGYQAWFLNCCKQPEQSGKTLTEQQLAFLQLWQPNRYSNAIDTAFIKELKDYFLS